MFNCSVCKQPSQPNTPATVVVTEIRPRWYYNEHPGAPGLVETIGTEIVKESLVCSTCAPQSLNQLNTLAPALAFLQPGVSRR